MQALSFDDVLIKPNYSDIISRRECDTSTKLTEEISLAIPLLSANMDTVTENEMCIRMALLGGLGVLHRYMTLERMIEQIQRVKNYTTEIVKNPYTLEKNKSSIQDYEELRRVHQVKTFPVVRTRGGKRYLTGIITNRDYQAWREDLDQTEWIASTTRELVTLTLEEYSPRSALKKMNRKRVEQILIVEKEPNEFGELELVGLVTRKDLVKLTQKYPNRTVDRDGKLRLAVAIGVHYKVEELYLLEQAGADLFVVDVAHGHHLLVENILKAIKNTSELKHVPVIVGNVATKQAVDFFSTRGADCIKVGIGPGSACTTRVVTGCGVPQFTAIQECTKHSIVPVIADGGIKNSGDIVKALYAGASTVMIGNLLAGTSDSPGKILYMDGKQMKAYRGMASHQAFHDKLRQQNSNYEFDQLYFHAEGKSGYVTYRGDTETVVDSLISGLKSGMSYTGSNFICELQEYGREQDSYYTITTGGLSESGSHDMIVG